MTDEKQPKTRIPAYDNERLKDALGDTTTNDFLAGAIYDFLEGDLDAEYYEMVAELRELEGETSEIDGRIDRIDDRIEELKEERERLDEERNEKEERIDEIEEELADRSTAVDGNVDGGRSTVEDVAYDLLVQVANDEIGSNGLAAGISEVREGAARANVEPGDVIVEMRRQAQPAADEMYQDGIVEAAFLTEEQLTPHNQNRTPEETFDMLREKIAEEVLDEEDVDWDEVPETEEISA
jgi:DNA repair exonuclease SbcCD ATPase subunit